MATDTRPVSVATTATRLDTAAETDLVHGSSIAVFNNGAATVFLGEADVATTTGYPLAAGEHYSEDADPADGLFGIVASGTVEVRVRETGI